MPEDMSAADHRREAERLLEAAWTGDQTERADTIATAHVHALLALSASREQVAGAPRYGVGTGPSGELTYSLHPAQLMPAPKGGMCAAGCGHIIEAHREAGCDVFDVGRGETCDCHAPFGRIMPGDPDPGA